MATSAGRVMRLDAHQHFWHYNPTDYVWMTDAMSILRRDYLPDDLEPLARAIKVEGTIAVQARQMLKETDWLLDLSEKYPLIRGVVGWVDLRAQEIRSQLERYAQHPKLKGVRHVVHDEPDDRFMALPEFRRGITQLADFGLTYDLLLFPRHLPGAVELVREFPQQPFVLDHIAKPRIDKGLFQPWERGLRELARAGNVTCKLSGLVTETAWGNWQQQDFHRYLDIVMDAFGVDRVMIGSDWPVCTLSGDYASIMGIVIDYVAQFPREDQEAILGTNCARFYGIKDQEIEKNT